MAEIPAQKGPTDPELEALPVPRRPWRRATLATMAVGGVLSVVLAGALVATASFSLQKGPPRELGSLTNVQLGPGLENTWAHGEAELSERSLEYRRPLDPDRYRLAEVAGNRSLWVELRIPSGIEPERYVPPNSFVGRLMPFARAGLRHSALADAVAQGFGHSPAPDAWVLIDGEAPSTTRWAWGLILLFLLFAAFDVWGIARLSKPVRSQ